MTYMRGSAQSAGNGNIPLMEHAPTRESEDQHVLSLRAIVLSWSLLVLLYATWQ